MSMFHVKNISFVYLVLRFVIMPAADFAAARSAADLEMLHLCGWTFSGHDPD